MATHGQHRIVESIRQRLATIVRSADCKRRQVASIIVDESGTTLGIGWNGLLAGSCRGGDCPRGKLSYEEQPAFTGYSGNCAALHAEVSAIKAAGERARGAVLYVTAQPCPGCKEAIRAAGLARVIVWPANRLDVTGVGPED